MKSKISISMLLPARGRPANLRTSVQSVFDLAADPDSVEVLVRLDDDDPHLREELAILEGHEAREVLVGVGPRLGYARMNDYYDALAAQARGDWIFFWNDDTDMVTRAWDELTRQCPLYSVQFPRRDTIPAESRPGYDGPLYSDYTFPVLGRPVLEALDGNMSKNPYCDAWLSDVSGFAGTSVVRPDVVFTHHRLNDQTLADQAGAGKQWQQFSAEQQKAMRIEAMQKVMAHPMWVARFDDWNVERFEHIGVDYIRLLEGERRAGAYRLLGRK